MRNRAEMTVGDFMEVSKTSDKNLLIEFMGSISVWERGREYILSPHVVSWLKKLTLAKDKGQMVIFNDFQSCCFPNDLINGIIDYPASQQHEANSIKYASKYNRVEIVSKEEARDKLSSWVDSESSHVEGMEIMLKKVEMGIYSDSKKANTKETA